MTTTEAKPSPRRAGLSAAKQALLEKWMQGGVPGEARARKIHPRPTAGPAPLSFAQKRLWFFTQLDPGSPLYNMPIAMRLRGPLHPDALHRALAALVERHASLRTRVVAMDGEPAQEVNPQSVFDWETRDLRAIPAEDRERVMEEKLAEAARRPFDLAKDPMLRGLLLHLGEADHVLLVSVHHLVSDGYSWGVFFDELAQLYLAGCRGEPAKLAELPIQYADYATWQHEWMDGEAKKNELAYWREKLAHAPATLELPGDHPRPAVQGFKGATLAAALPDALAAGLRELSRRKGTTLFMTLLAAFKTLLYRHTHQTDLLIGTPIAGRSHLETERMIGLFVNTLPLRTDLSGDPTFEEALQRVRQVTLDAYGHQDLPFDKLVEELQPERSSSYAPLVQVMFVLQDNSFSVCQLHGIASTPIRMGTGTAKFDLTMAVEEEGQHLTTVLEYNSELFEPATIERMLGHWRNLLEGIVAAPGCRISALPLLTDRELNQLLVDWNNTASEYPRDQTIAGLFEETVRRYPGNVAVEFGGRRLTYRELNAAANRLAHALTEWRVGPDVLVGVCLERSVEMVIALLAIVKAGGAYVSFDPGYPAERLALMLADAQPQVMLTQESHLSLLANAGEGCRCVCVDSALASVSAERDQNPRALAGPENLAYVSFTSGSTGRPKGACIPHRGVVRLVRGANYARFGPDEVFLQLAPIAFDASTLEIWGALLNGSRLVVYPPGTPSLGELGQLIRSSGVTTLWLTAGLFHQMVEEQLESLANVRQLLAGGDVLSPPHVRRVLERFKDCQLINGYGPTENTTFTCCHRITEGSIRDRSVPIGPPISNTQVFVLDEQLQPVPIGVRGELYAGGDGLANGYLNRPELTAQKFVVSPFAADPGTRLYRTGDWVRWRGDGVIEFLGRNDGQVKIRGIRIELGEIEQVLGGHPGVRECALRVEGDGAGEKRLLAYVVDSAAPASVAELRDYLRARLPAAMIPARFIRLAELPLNQNGKVDRDALARASAGQETADGSVSGVLPRDAVEAELAEIWAGVLGVSDVGVTDNFFDLGGHSLMAVRLVAQIERRMGKKLRVLTIFQSPTIEQLARAMSSNATPPANTSVAPIQPKGTKPPLYLVHGVGGGMLWGYSNLARYLGDDQPVYAFESRGMTGQKEFDRIEEMAAQYVADLRTVQPQGPYYIGGYCFGGNVAYEMARLLQAGGQEVALLALMNCAPPNSTYTQVKWTPVLLFRFLVNLRHWVAYFLSWTSAQRRDFVKWKWRSLCKRVGRLFGRSGGAGKPVAAEEFVDLTAFDLSQRQLWEAHIRALFQYTPQAYPGQVSLFRSRCHQFLCSFDPHCGWGDLASGGVTVKIVPGAHESILDEPYVSSVAMELKICLTEKHLQATGLKKT